MKIRRIENNKHDVSKNMILNYVLLIKFQISIELIMLYCLI